MIYSASPFRIMALQWDKVIGIEGGELERSRGRRDCCERVGEGWNYLLSDKGKG